MTNIYIYSETICKIDGIPKHSMAFWHLMKAAAQTKGPQS